MCQFPSLLINPYFLNNAGYVTGLRKNAVQRQIDWVYDGCFFNESMLATVRICKDTLCETRKVVIDKSSNCYCKRIHQHSPLIRYHMLLLADDEHNCLHQNKKPGTHPRFYRSPAKDDYRCGVIDGIRSSKVRPLAFSPIACIFHSPLWRYSLAITWAVWAPCTDRS
jgi:hypothetical protein